MKIKTGLQDNRYDNLQETRDHRKLAQSNAEGKTVMVWPQLMAGRSTKVLDNTFPGK